MVFPERKRPSRLFKVTFSLAFEQHDMHRYKRNNKTVSPFALTKWLLLLPLFRLAIESDREVGLTLAVETRV